MRTLPKKKENTERDIQTDRNKVRQKRKREHETEEQIDTKNINKFPQTQVN